MTVSFYSVSGRSNDINKLDGVTGFSVDVTLYNDFNPAAPTFYLDRLRDANYCRFIYNGKTWVCSISLVSFTDNIAVYSGSVDALATAWYNDCMRSEQLVQYSANGNGHVEIDRRVQVRSVASHNVYDLDNYNIGNNQQGLYAVVTVLMPATYAQQYTPPWSPDPVEHNINNPGNPLIMCYWLSLEPQQGGSVFDDFCRGFYDMTDTEMQHYGQSILNITIVPEEYLPTNPLEYQARNSIDLYTIGSTDQQTKRRTIQLDGNAYWTVSCSGHYRNIKHFTGGGLDVTSELLDAQISIYLCDVGVINFKLASIAANINTITSMGADIIIDFAGGTISAYAVINDVDYPHLFVSSPYTWAMPVFMDTSITNWTSMAVSGLLTIGSIVAVIGTGGAAAPPVIAGSIMAAAGGAASTASAYTSAMQGSISTHGGHGGDIDIVAGRKSAIIINEYDAVDLAGFQALYGKPDGRRVNISHLSGYVQTLGARLPLNGLPYDIVQAAEGGLNAGAYII